MDENSSYKRNISSNSLTPEEDNLLSIALDEYDDLFPNIMTCPQADFIPILERYIQIALVPKGKVYPSGTLSKIIKIIQHKYYEPEYLLVNKLIQSIDNIKACEKLSGNNYVPHCNSTSTPVHKCGDKLYMLGTYLLCLKCKLIYRSTCVMLHCDSCDVDYYTSIDKDNNLKYKPATWEKYHCNAILNDVMKCFKCKNCFYINVYNKKLCCLKCNFEIDQKRIKWKCIICGEEFLSDAKVYNQLEFKNMKMAVKQSIYEGIEAKPDYVPCCDLDKTEIEKYKFYHKKECNGIIYLGMLDKKKIVVCSKCHKLYYYEHHYWTCPICKERFRLSSGSTPTNQQNSSVKRNPRHSSSNNSSEKDSSYYRFQERKNSQILRYDTPNSPNYGKYHEHSNNQSGNKDRRGMIDNESQGRNRGASTNCIRANRNKPGSKGISVFKLNMDNVPVEERFHAKSPNKRMNMNNMNDLGKKLYNININVNVNIDNTNNNITTNNYNNNINNNANGNAQTGNIRKIPLPFNIRRKDSSTVGSNSSTGPKTTTSNSNFSNNSNEDSNIINNNNIGIIRSNSNSPQTNTTMHLASPQSNFNSDDYTILRQIGEGTFGKIYAVEDKNKKRYAMKKILANSLDEISALKSELDMLISLSKYKLNLVTIYGVEYKQLDKTTFVMYVLMDLAVRDWEKEIEFRKMRKNFYTEQELIVILKELTFTFAELQRHNISHRDIKPQNILLFPDQSFRIADFGEAKEVLQNNIHKNTLRQTIRGTELYMSPILFHALNTKGAGAKYTEHNTFKSDVFSLGLCFLLAATLTFNSLVDIRELTDMLSIKIVLGRYLKGKYSSKFTEILYNMLEINEKDRKDFIELNKYVENM